MHHADKLMVAAVGQVDTGMPIIGSESQTKERPDGKNREERQQASKGNTNGTQATDQRINVRHYAEIPNSEYG